MHYLAIFIVFILTVGAFSEIQAQQPTSTVSAKKREKKASGDKAKEKRIRNIRKRKKMIRPKILDEKLCANKDDEKNTFELKSTDHHCVLKGVDADAYLLRRDVNVCREPDKQVICVPGTRKYREIGLRKGGYIESCAVTCINKKGYNGEASKISPNPKRSYISYGAYRDGIKVGRWEQGPWSCSSCERRITEVSNYNKKGRLSGTQWRWMRSGSLSKKIVYSATGKLVSSESFIYDQVSQSTRLRERTLFKKGKRFETREWDRNGNIRKKASAMIRN